MRHVLAVNFGLHQAILRQYKKVKLIKLMKRPPVVQCYSNLN